MGVASYFTDLSLDLDADENFLVVWDHYPAIDPITVQRYDPGGNLLLENDLDSGIDPEVVTTGDGGFVVVYETPSYDVMLHRYDSLGEHLGAEILVNTYTTGFQGDPGLAVDPFGNLIVTWSSYQVGIRGQRFKSDGSRLGSVFQVNDATSGGSSAVVADANGAFLVTWADSGEIWARRFDPLNATDVDVSITKSDGLTEALPGEEITYTVTVANSGPGDVSDVTVSDVFPEELEGCSWTSVADGATGNTKGSGNLDDVLDMPAPSSVTYTATCTIALDALTLSNTATATVSGDTDLANNSATDDDTTLQVANLAIDQATSSDPLCLGEPFTYTLTVSNAGPRPAASVMVSDTLPAGMSATSAGGDGWSCQLGATVSCSRAVLEVGEAPPITLTLDGPLMTGVLSNSVLVETSFYDPNLADNSQVAAVSVLDCLFSNGFELGNTLAWSATFPMP
jgi:uncharacterized repeat protein (TIGR01451 family)